MAAAIPGQSVTIRLEDDIDIGRGDMLADPERPPVAARELEATLCWMSERPLEPRARVVVKHTTRTVRAIVEELRSVVDIETLEDTPSPARFELNDIGRVKPAPRRAARRRPVRAEPRDRRVHPDRRGDERDGRRRDGGLARERDLAVHARRPRGRHLVGMTGWAAAR